MKAIEIRSTIEKEDLKKMLITAMFFRSPLFLPIIILASFAFSYVSWNFQKMSGYLSLLILWLGFLFVLLFILVRKALGQMRHGELSFVGREQTYRFTNTHFSYSPAKGKPFTDLTYDRIRHVSSFGDFVILYVDKNAALAMRKKDMSSEELITLLRLLRNKRTK